MLSASVPPLVKTISAGLAWISAASWRRAASRRCLARLPEMVDAGSVTIHLTETRHHGLQHFGSDGRGGVVVEVEMLHLHLILAMPSTDLLP